MLGVLPLYDSSCLQSQQYMPDFFFLSGSMNFSSRAGEPKKRHTGLLTFSRGRNSSLAVVAIKNPRV
jgi:hypothetical protein